jgi:hypothetical protein
MAGWEAAPAGAAQRKPPPSGSSGTRPGGITTAVPGAGWTGTGRKRVTPPEASSQEARIGAVRRPQKRRGKPQMERRVASAFRKRADAARRRDKVRHTALHPSPFR